MAPAPRLTEFPPATALGKPEPPQLVRAFGGLATTTPGGKVSVNTVVSVAVVGFGFIRVTVNTDIAPALIDAGLNDLLIEGLPGASAQYRLARGRTAAAERQMQVQRDQETRVTRQFDSGAADRMQRLAAHLDTLAAGTALRMANVDLRQALAQLEDAVQRPLLGDFESLPDVTASRSAGLATP